jgi:hypothetical protein
MASPWLLFRQARAAVATDRPDEAHRLIEPLLAEGYRQAWKLARDVVKSYCTRGRRYLDVDNADAAWVEVLAAEALNTGEKCVAELRTTLTRFGLVQARGALEAGRPLDAVGITSRLRDRGVRNVELARAEEAAQDWVLAAELADKGEFLRALAQIDRLRPKLPCPATGLDRCRAEVEARHEQFRAAVGRLYDAAEARHWREAVAAADAVLAAAPEHRDAHVLRSRAWQAIHPETLAHVPAADEAVNGRRSEGARERRIEPALAATVAGPAHGGSPSAPHPLLSSGHGGSPASPLPPGPAVALPKKFFLWVDGAGGFLVCTGPRVTFGQAVADGPIDVPLYADVSRLHAEISRDGEGYVIESGKGVLVNGKEVSRAVLAPGDRVTLGATCQFLFKRPVSVSATARLDLASGHRLLHPVDAVILMGNDLMLGPPGSAAHVQVPDAPGPIGLFRSPEGLGVRCKGHQFRVGDRVHADRATLTFPAVVSTDAFSFAVEPVGPRG